MNQFDDNLRVDENLIQSQEQLDKFEKENNVFEPKGDYEPEVKKYFEMDRRTLERLSKEDCAVAAYELAQYSYWIQRALNRENSKLRWAESALDVYVGKVGKQYKTSSYIKYEEIKNIVIADNSHSAALFAAKMTAQLRVDRLFFLAGKIEFMSKTMLGLKHAKYDNNSQ
jgi:hypothetical protein